MHRNRLLGRLLQAFAALGIVIAGLVLGSPRAGDTEATVGLVLCVAAFVGGAWLAQDRSTA